MGPEDTAASEDAREFTLLADDDAPQLQHDIIYTHSLMMGFRDYQISRHDRHHLSASILQYTMFYFNEPMLCVRSRYFPLFIFAFAAAVLRLFPHLGSCNYFVSPRSYQISLNSAAVILPMRAMMLITLPGEI